MSAIARPALRQLPRTLKSFNAPRTFSVAARVMAEGDTGATRSGGAASSDAFNKREGAEEAMYVRKQEREKLLKKIRAAEAEAAKHKEDLEKLEKNSKK